MLESKSKQLVEVFKIVKDYVKRPQMDQILQRVKVKCPEMDIDSSEAFKEVFPDLISGKKKRKKNPQKEE